MIRVCFLSSSALLLFAACSSSDDGDTAPSTGKRVSLTGMVVLAPAFTPTADAEECVVDSNPASCATSGSDGTITVSLPASSRTGLIMNYPDAIPCLTPVTTADEDLVLVGRAGWPNPAAGVIIPNGLVQGVEALLGVQLDPAKGYADFNSGQLNGGTVTVEGQTGVTAWYLQNGAPQLVSALGGGPLPADASLLGFINIDPGDVIFQAEKNGQPCEWDPVTYHGDEPGTATVPIRAGTWTRLFEVRCN